MRRQAGSMGLVARIERVLARLARWSLSARRLVLLLAVLSVPAAGWAARGLRVDADLTHLLPASFESVQRVEQLAEQTAGFGYVSVVVTGGTAQSRRALADALASRLEALPTIAYVDHRRPTAFFATRALYYLDVDDLRQIRDRLEARRLWEVRQRSPLYDLGLDELGDPPSVDFSALRDAYQARARAKGLELSDADGSASAYYEDLRRGMLVLMARPARRSSDVGFNGRVVRQVRAAVDGFDTRRYGADISLRLSGRYQKKADQQKQIESDLAAASLLALVLMVAFLALHFRRGRAVALVLAPLLLGLGWTFALAALLFGSLNLLTAFTGAMLLGIGIDHGIHLLSRVRAEQAAGATLEQAVAQAYGRTGRAVVAAALTTIVAFVGVSISEFRAFRELGVLAAAGLGLIVLSYSTVLPALLGLGDPAAARRQSAPSRYARALPRWAPALGWLAVLGAVAATSRLPLVRFDYDFAALEDSGQPSSRLDAEVNRLLGRSQTPLAVLTRGPAEERAAVAAVRTAMKRRGGPSAVAMALSLDDFVPAHAAAKAPLLTEIGEQLGAIKPAWLQPAQRQQRARLLKMTRAAPFGRAELPIELRRGFEARDGERSLVLLFPAVRLSDGVAVRALAAELRAVELPDGSPLPVAGGAMVLADVLDMVVQEAPWVLGVTGVLVLAALWLLLGGAMVLPCALTAATTLGVTAGLMPLLGLRFNYLNIALLPVLFGMAVDGAVHLLLRYREDGDLVATVRDTGRAVAGAILTTALGFAAFGWAHHRGLRSLGALAVLGLAVNLLVTLVALPAWLALRARSRRIGAAQGRARLLTRLAVTLGLAGDAPVAPGTLGALIALPIGLAAQRLGGGARAALAAILSVTAVLLVARYLRRGGAHDPREVVIDELVGCLVAVVMVPQGIGWALGAFGLFRLLDILKPWPVGYIDRRVRGAWGVVGDDLVAGLLAGATLLVLHRLGLAGGWWS